MKKDSRWDENNKPTTYIIGVSPGFSEYMKEPDAKLNFQGFWRKIMKATRFGFEFVMVDYEALSEMYEPDIDRKVQQIKETENVEVGVHLPFYLDLTLAYSQDWDYNHQMLIRGVYASVKLIKARWALVHSANSIHTALTFKMGGYERPGNLCAFDGTNLGNFLEAVEDGSYRDPWWEHMRGRGFSGGPKKYPLKGWFIAKFLKTLFTGMAISPEPIVAVYEFENFYEALDTYSSILLAIWDAVSSQVQTLSSELENYDRLRNEINQLKMEQMRISREIQQLKEQMQKEPDRADEYAKQLEQASQTLQQINQEISAREEQLNGYNVNFNVSDIAKRIASIIESVNKAKSLLSDDRTDRTEAFRILGLTIARELYELFSELSLKGLKTPSADAHEIFQAINTTLDEQVASHNLAYASNPRIYIKLIEGLAIHVSHYNTDVWFESWRTHGSEGTESQAYRTVAKYMYITRDEIWREVVEKDYGIPIDPDIVIDMENGVKEVAYAMSRRNPELRKTYDLVNSLDPAGRRRLMEKISAAVAGKYIEGHLFATNGKTMGSMGFVVAPEGQEALTEEEKKMCVYDYLKKHRLQFYIENGFNNQQGGAGMGKVRIMHMTDHCRIIHSIDRGAFTNYCPDFEHLMINFIDPAKDIEKIDDNGPNGLGYAQYITQIHINAPRPKNATHGPINPLSTDMLEIYRWLYGLWTKGMRAAHFIWEMGSFGVRQSALAFRKFREALEKDPPPPPEPEKLGKEFFGIDEKFMAAMELAIHEHGLDALQGMMLVPEEKHGFMGNAVKQKGKIQDWEAEEFI